MEKRTIGGFIATLRKAQGMTQRELAERLNVSDKTVSRWERDDGSPDLSVIPVLAEIFEVTCDELLRGERRSPAERMDPEVQSAGKGEKQRQRLLASSLSRYRARTFLSMGLAVMGLIAAMVGNFALLRAYIGFFAASVCSLAAIICQAVWINSAFLAVSDESLTDGEIGSFKRAVVRLAEGAFGLTAVLLGFSLPLVILPGDPYVGLNGETWLLQGAVLAGIVWLAVMAAGYFLNGALLKRGMFSLEERELRVLRDNHRLKAKCGAILALALVVTFRVHMALTTIWGPWTIMEGTQFDDYESFVAYMEQPSPEPSMNGEPTEIVGGETYYDAQGNPISREQALRRTLEDSQGRVVCTFLEENREVVSLRYEPQDSTVLPITVYTEENRREAEQKAAMRHVIFAGLYGVELACTLVFYLRKRAK